MCVLGSPSQAGGQELGADGNTEGSAFRSVNVWRDDADLVDGRYAVGHRETGEGSHIEYRVVLGAQARRSCANHHRNDAEHT